MLQYQTCRSKEYSAAEQAQMMLEGGCRWIQVTKADEGMSLRETLDAIRPMCEETEAFLIVDSDVELALETRIHGVHLHKGDMAPAEAREVLGPHAVIGVEVESLDDILALRGIDVDYATLGNFGPLTLEDYAKVTSGLSQEGMELPIVAVGEITLEDLRPIIGTGCKGVAMSRVLIDATDPVRKCEEALALLKNG